MSPIYSLIIIVLTGSHLKIKKRYNLGLLFKVTGRQPVKGHGDKYKNVRRLDCMVSDLQPQESPDLS